MLNTGLHFKPNLLVTCMARVCYYGSRKCDVECPCTEVEVHLRFLAGMLTVLTKVIPAFYQTPQGREGCAMAKAVARALRVGGVLSAITGVSWWTE